jgi:SAM-dependent methyltransferase
VTGDPTSGGLAGRAVADHVRMNRRSWNETSDGYQQEHGPQISGRLEPGWGVWQIPERELGILGDVAGRDVLELGCGAAQWSILLAGRGARPVGLDLSDRQLWHARRLMAAAGASFPLLHASAEQVPLRDGSFDVVFCDHGAMSFADPAATVPEAARLLRPGGLLAFSMGTPILDMCWSDGSESVEPSLQGDYFGMGRLEFQGEVTFQVPYGEWIRLFRTAGLVIEELVELRPPEGATTTYGSYVPYAWARRWPAEHVWKLRKPAQSSRGSASASRS